MRAQTYHCHEGEREIMATQEIQQNQWTVFLDDFSRQHEGWLASVEVMAADIGAQLEVENLPLEGITVASKQSEPETIAISLGKTPEDHITHTIKDPTHLWLEQAAAGANAALEIESDEVKVLLRFRTPSKQ
jgi:hypothetical protein